MPDSLYKSEDEYSKEDLCVTWGCDSRVIYEDAEMVSLKCLRCDSEWDQLKRV